MAFTFDVAVKDIVQGYASDYSARFGLPNSRVKLLNVDLSTLTAATDVALGFGKPLKEIVDLNFQTGADAHLPQRGLLYNAALALRHRVPVCSIFILMRPEANHRNLTGTHSYNDEAHRVEFRYDVVRLWQEPAESFLQGGIGLLPLAVLGKLPTDLSAEEAMRQLVLRIEARLLAETGHAEAAKLMNAAFILTGLRLEKNIAARIYQGIGIMHESSTYQLILDEGIKKGEIKGKQKTLIRMGEHRFGAPTAEEVESIKTVTNLRRLDRLLDALFTSKNWRELLATR